MKLILRKNLFLVIFSLIFIFAATIYAGDNQTIALININNYSGVDSVGGQKLNGMVTEAFNARFNKQFKENYRNLNSTEEQLRKAGLDGFYEAKNLCTNRDLALISQKIGVSQIGVLEINGYSEVKREKSGKSYQLLLGLKVYNSKDGAELYYTGEGLSNRNRTDAVEQAVINLCSAYQNLQTENIGESSLRGQKVPVIGHKLSKTYHLPQSNHLPKTVDQVAFKSRDDAETGKFRPCPICFPSYKSYYNSDRQLEEALGAEGCGTLEYYYRLADDPEMIAKLRRIAIPLIADTTRKHVDYHFRILETPEINAYSAPNGYIYFTQGLMEIMETDDEIAFVLAHELGHIECKHAVISYRKAQALSLLTAILIAGSNNNSNEQNAAALFAVVMANIIMKGYSREMENEADEMALTHLKRTGRDYNAYCTVMGKFIDLRQNKISSIDKIFSTHPSPEDRIKNLDQYQKAYQELQAKLGY